jgi:hypothetical protein
MENLDLCIGKTIQSFVSWAWLLLDNDEDNTIFFLLIGIGWHEEHYKDRVSAHGLDDIYMFGHGYYLRALCYVTKEVVKSFRNRTV